jgi:plasmid stability protein
MKTTMVQIRNVPVDFHRRLKARAAMEGMSMSDYILRELRKSLDRPSRAEVLQRIRARSTPDLPVDVASLIREGRDSR